MPHAAGQTLKPLVRLGRRPDECWKWTGAISPNGYGKKQVGGRTLLAHRWLWEQLFGPIPASLVVAHSCGNRSCVSPHHLRLCTQAEGIRAGTGTTLTAGDAEDIRRLYDGGLMAPLLADRFGVAESTIKSIVQRRSWRRLRNQSGTTLPSSR